MAIKINWTQNYQVVDGPNVTGTGTVEADAYDKIEVKVPKTNGKVTVEVLPAGATGKVKFLLVKSDNYAKLTYDVDPPNGTVTGVALDAQLLLVGEGALKLAGGAPKSLLFKNTGASDANVQILIARDVATTTP